MIIQLLIHKVQKYKNLNQFQLIWYCLKINFKIDKNKLKNISHFTNKIYKNENIVKTIYSWNKHIIIKFIIYEES